MSKPNPNNAKRARTPRDAGQTSIWPTLAMTAGLLALGVVSLPNGWARSARTSVQSPEMNRADREADAGGYYEGLMTGAGGPDGGRSELALRLLGKPVDWVRFQAAGVARPMLEDFLQFELRAGVSRTIFGRLFTTNELGMRDRPYSVEKPEGVYRIALVGSSMDMGWGVRTGETYENLLEDWLNAHAEKRGIERRFEVLNFAVAAYGPLQRIELFDRKVKAFEPDLVIYSATMLDVRLLEIHLCNLLHRKVDLRHEFLRRAVAEAGVIEADLPDDRASRESLKRKLRPRYGSIEDDALGKLASDCRSAGRRLLLLIVPRVGQADAPAERASTVARYREAASGLRIPIVDLSAVFDDQDPARLEIAPWDDHPNALGHKLLFRALARALVDDPELYRTLFADGR